MNAASLAAEYLAASVWNERKCSERELDTVFESRAAEDLLLRVRFRGTGVEVSEGELGTHQYFPGLFNFFQHLQQCRPLNGSILVSLLDGAPGSISGQVPVLSFAKLEEDTAALLIPDPYYLDNVGYPGNYAVIDRLLESIRYEERIPAVYWRGSSTGVPVFAPETWRENPRAKLCLRGLEIPELLNARISRVVQGGGELKENPEVRAILGEWEPLEQNLVYRFGLDIDGNACAWGLIQKLYMDLAVVKVRSPWMQWYYPLLEDRKNILFVNSDLSDLEAVITELRADSDAARSIALAARKLVGGLDYAQALVYGATLLDGLCTSLRMTL